MFYQPHFSEFFFHLPTQIFMICGKSPGWIETAPTHNPTTWFLVGSLHGKMAISPPTHKLDFWYSNRYYQHLLSYQNQVGGLCVGGVWIQPGDLPLTQYFVKCAKNIQNPNFCPSEELSYAPPDSYCRTFSEKKARVIREFSKIIQDCSAFSFIF